MDEKGVFLDLERCLLFWNGKQYDIHYRYSSPHRVQSKIDDLCQRIAYRFYIDYSVCGFLSKGARAYATHVEEKPEILVDIGNLIDMDIATEWKYTHTSYEVTAIVSSKDINPIGSMLNYAELAFWNAFNEEIEQNVLICKNHVHIYPSKIINISEFRGWH